MAANADDVNEATRLLAIGRTQEAEAAFERILREGVDEFLAGDSLTDAAVFYRGFARFQLGKFAAAGEDAEAAITPRSSFSFPDRGYWFRALLELAAGKNEAAFADYDKAVEVADKGMGSGSRTFLALAQRGYARLLTGDKEKARADFAAALATDTRMMGIDLAPLGKPFLDGFVDTVLPAIEAGDAARAQQALDVLISRLGLMRAAAVKTTQAAMPLATADARGILIEQVGGPLRLVRMRWQEKARAEAAARNQEAAARVRAWFAEAQQAVAAHRPEEAFSLYVRAYREAPDREGRDGAIRGLASVLPLLSKLPEPDENLNRLVARARVFIEEKDYAKAVQAYWEAIDAAPWFAQLHYDRALLIAQVARSKADFDAAIGEMQRYILLAPGAGDVRAARDRIYEWEARAERAPQ